MTSDADSVQVGVESLVVGPLAENCHVLWCMRTNKAVIVDPGYDEARIVKVVRREQLDVEWVLLTHGHVDHVGAVAPVARELGVPVAVHEADEVMLRAAPQMAFMFGLAMEQVPDPGRLLSDGDRIEVGDMTLETIHTPGHTPGSVSFLVRGAGILLSGDTLFYRGVGRTDLPGGSWVDLVHSIRSRLYVLDGDTKVLTGHGPATTIGGERQMNPFVTG